MRADTERSMRRVELNWEAFWSAAACGRFCDPGFQTVLLILACSSRGARTDSTHARGTARGNRAQVLKQRSPVAFLVETSVDVAGCTVRLRYGARQETSGVQHQSPRGNSARLFTGAGHLHTMWAALPAKVSSCLTAVSHFASLARRVCARNAEELVTCCNASTVSWARL